MSNKRGNIANLIPFKKGEIHNPKGRPKINATEKKLREVFEAIANERTTSVVSAWNEKTQKVETQTKNVTKWYGLCKAVWKEAMAGKAWAVQTIFERMEGRAAQAILLGIVTEETFKGDDAEKYVQDYISEIKD